MRFFTPDEARATLPRLKPLLAQLREAFHAYRFARAQVDELLAMFGEDPSHVAGHPQAAETRRWKMEAQQGDARVREAITKITALGADVKDPVIGLVDFYAKRPTTGETVLLCYRDDEVALDYWHPLTTGFAGRRPLAEF